MQLHSVSKITLRSTNFARTERFYNELFGWDFHQYSLTYLTIRIGIAWRYGKTYLLRKMLQRTLVRSVRVHDPNLCAPAAVGLESEPPAIRKPGRRLVEIWFVVRAQSPIRSRGNLHDMNVGVVRASAALRCLKC